MHLPWISKALSDDEVPVPGYIYEEFNKLTNESVQVCTELQSYLLKKLTVNSCHVKFKALRVLKHIVEKGHPGFRADLQRRTESIRDAMSYRGPLHPLHGDALYVQVRNAASELMDVLYNAPPLMQRKDMSYNINSNNISNSYATEHRKSFEDDSHRRDTSDRSDSGKIIGFGNSNSDSSDQQPGFFLRLKDRIYDASNGYITSGNMLINSFYGYSCVEGSMGGSMNRHIDQALAADYKVNENITTSGSAGSEWGVDTNREHMPVDGIPLEYSLVSVITQPGGVRSTPPREALSEFVSRCSSLDCYKIANALSERVNSQEWQVTLKALVVVEALLRSDIVGIIEYMGCIGSLAQRIADTTTQQSVRERAFKVLRMLYSTSTTVDNNNNDSSVKGETTQELATTSSLLDLNTSNGVASPPWNQSKNGSYPSLFLGMNISSSSSHPVTTGTNMYSNASAMPIQRIALNTGPTPIVESSDVVGFVDMMANSTISENDQAQNNLMGFDTTPFTDTNVVLDNLSIGDNTSVHNLVSNNEVVFDPLTVGGSQQLIAEQHEHRDGNLMMGYPIHPLQQYSQVSRYVSIGNQSTPSVQQQCRQQPSYRNINTNTSHSNDGGAFEFMGKKDADVFDFVSDHIKSNQPVKHSKK